MHWLGDWTDLQGTEARGKDGVGRVRPREGWGLTPSLWSSLSEFLANQGPRALTGGMGAQGA